MSGPSKNSIFVGIYGVPGSGKSRLLHALKFSLPHEEFSFYEASEMISTLVPGGLAAFQHLPEQTKVFWRRLAIETIRKQCAISEKTAVVAGNFMFWPEENEAGHSVCTQADLRTFTHILYLDVPAERVAYQCQEDKSQIRPLASVAHLHKWQEAEKVELRGICYENGILFSLLRPHSDLLSKVAGLIHNIQLHSEEKNMSLAENAMFGFTWWRKNDLETMLLIDADGTLTAQYTTELFWERVSKSRHCTSDNNPLKTLFKSSIGYSYTAFRQAALLYEEIDEQGFDDIYQQVASEVTMNPEMISMLQLTSSIEDIGVVIVTCGLSLIWEKVMEKEGLHTVLVIGGGRLNNGTVVTPAVKANLVTHLQNEYDKTVWAFGDSPLDLEMLIRANHAVVVVGDEKTRSKSMEAAVLHAIETQGLQAHQALLPDTASPMLDTNKLPLLRLTSREFVRSLLTWGDRVGYLPTNLATDRPAAKLLATPMRDAATTGPALREAHRSAGRYLATEFVPAEIGLEECPISHVLGHRTSGYRLLHENKTTIVAIMRAGEPMALGVSDVFPLATFLHANRPEDIKLHHVKGQLNVLLVDSVINSGKTMLEFVEAIRNLHATIRIVIVAGVVQAQCASFDSVINRALGAHGNTSLVALRCSVTKFTGTGGTDTGNRLFNTTHLP
jgi:uracil phosphoribosyltransferase/phosphoserine phosphatase